MELHFLETTVTLLFVLHIKYLYQLKRNNFLVFHPLSFENIRELALTYKLQNFETINTHADVQHHIILRVGLLVIVRIHLRLHRNVLFFVVIILCRHVI